jgi:hypothetical protein
MTGLSLSLHRYGTGWVASTKNGKRPRVWSLGLDGAGG